MILKARANGIPIGNHILVKKYGKWKVKKVSHEGRTYYFATTPDDLPISKAIKVPDEDKKTIKIVLQAFKEVYKLGKYKSLTK